MSEESWKHVGDIDLLIRRTCEFIGDNPAFVSVLAREVLIPLAGMRARLMVAASTVTLPRPLGTDRAALAMKRAQIGKERDSCTLELLFEEAQVELQIAEHTLIDLQKQI